MTYLVILDPGHGLNTPGKRTPNFPDGSFMRENEFNRNVVRKIDTLLERHENIDVIFTTTEKRDIDLTERVARVNSLYDKVKNLYDKIVLVSIHANALNGIWGTQNGTSTYHYPTNMTDKGFAEVIHKNLLEKTGLTDRGVLGGNFQIIREVKMTACLCECAFMDNKKEAELLRTDEFRQACAEGIVNGLREYFDMADRKVEYKTYNANIHELKGNPIDLTVEIVDKRIWDITEYTNCVNGTFYWYNSNNTTYATSILIKDGQILKNEADHYYRFGCPQNVFIIYKNGKVEMKKVYFAHDLDYKNIKVAVGGVGLRDTTNPNFKYDPASEGFKKGINKITGLTEDQSGVLRKTNKTVIGYSKTTGKVYLLTVRNISHGDLIKLISTGESYDIALSLDGGGSTFMDANNKYVFQGQNTRRIHNILRFK